MYLMGYDEADQKSLFGRSLFFVVCCRSQENATTLQKQTACGDSYASIDKGSIARH